MSKRRIEAIIDTKAFKDNLIRINEGLETETKVYAVVKANAYGHGAVALSKEARKLDFIYGFAVATTDEAMELRDGGIKEPIIILGETFSEDDEYIILNDIMPAVTSIERAKELSRKSYELKRDVKIQIKLDTGMGRIGFGLNDESYKEISEIFKLPGLKSEGLFTHFARADETDISPARLQLDKFLNAKENLLKRGVEFNQYHCSNSAASIRFKEANLTQVRAGIIIYGLPPSDEVDISGFTPVLSLKSHITFLKTVPKGTAISYGGTFVSDREMRIATVPVGYGDGYPRSLSNKGFVLICGKRAKILGRVCMDQFMVDVTDIPKAALYEEVVIVGKSGEDEISVEELSRLSGRFPYEFVCCLGQRIPRSYI